MIKVTTHTGSKSYALATDYDLDRHGIYLTDKDGNEVARFHPNSWSDIVNLDLSGEIVDIDFLMSRTPHA
jgi:hypothetical protein